MAKKAKKKYMPMIPAILVMICAVLMIVSFFTPFLNEKSIVTDTADNLTGIDLIKGAGSDSLEDVTSNGGESLMVKLMLESDETGAATYTLVIGSILGLILGFLLFLFSLFGLFSKSKIMRIGAKLTAGLGVVSGIMSIAAAAALANKLTSVALAVTVSVGGIMLLTVSVIAMLGLLVFKKN